YSRDAFLTAAGYYPNFGRTGSDDVARREIAAFFAHVTDVTDHLCYIEAMNRTSNCDTSRTDWPCVSGRDYYGRGPLQLTWNYNYGAAGQAIGFDRLSASETVANDNVISFRTALWYWMSNCHSLITSGEGFGSTIRMFNGACDGSNPVVFNVRIGYYRDYCSQFGVDPGANLTCSQFGVDPGNNLTPMSIMPFSDGYLFLN
ncbi:chitinase 6-like, partial [Curcuma longa]|uniref:chitinase 6-like n=1 Tax=Curcuma longa TaxID=136217 RepID=UPI003D9EF773